MKTKEFRCTRGAPYTHPCAGEFDLTARQGYYLRAVDEADALRQMRTMFPFDKAAFTAHYTKMVNA